MRNNIPLAPGSFFSCIPRTGSNSVCAALGVPHYHRTAEWLKVNHKAKRVACFIREPLAHKLSWFLYHAYRGVVPGEPAIKEFHEWVRQEMPLQEPFVPRWDYREHYLDQCKYASHADFVGRYELLPEDFERLKRWLVANGGHPSIEAKQLPHRYGVGKKTGRVGFVVEDFYDSATKKIVRQMFPYEFTSLPIREF